MELPTSLVHSSARLDERGGWLGPLFYWEIVREGRRGRNYLPRILYAFGLLLLLYLILRGADVTLKDAANFGEQSFNYYLVFQYLAVLLLTPIYVAGTFIEDRQQGSLPLLLTTYLTPWELVVGKMLGRLMPMLAVFLAGMPVLAILQLLGGISLPWLIYHTVSALLLLLLTGMHSIRSSTLHATVGATVFYAYLRVLGSLFLGYLFALVAMVFFGMHAIGSSMTVFTVTFWVVNLWLAMNSLNGATASLKSRRRGEDRSLPELAQEAIRSPVISSKLEPAHSETDDEPTDFTKPLTLPEIVHEIQHQNRSPDAFRWPTPPVYRNWAIVWKPILFPEPTEPAGWFIHLLVYYLPLPSFPRKQRQPSESSTC